MKETISPTYLVIGAGATSLAFVDELLSNTSQTTTIALIDRYAAPGGHWTTAYPFVRLHQPSSFYGVNSRRLGEERIEQIGWNQGLMDLATCHEINDYFFKVVDDFRASGWVKWFPKSEYMGNGEWREILTGKEWAVGKETKIVDATYVEVKVPSMGPPSYKVEKGVNLTTPNDLVKINRPYTIYTVVGAGKTGIDAALWLLSMGISPEKINWIMPRDPWLVNRAAIQPGPQSADRRKRDEQNFGAAVMTATSVDDFYRRLQATQNILRFDEEVWPTRYHGATISPMELEQIQRIKCVIRMGRVLEIRPDEVLLQKGSYKPDADTLFIDCAADGLKKADAVPVFQGNTIILQAVSMWQSVFSGAFIAHVEKMGGDDEAKNHLCYPIPHPEELAGFPKALASGMRSTVEWWKVPETVAWLENSRLKVGVGMDPWPKDPERRQAALREKSEQFAGLSQMLFKLVGEGTEVQ